MKTAAIYENLTYKENIPSITVLLETPFTKEIRIAMKQGQVMKEHKTPHPIVIQLVEGAIDFGVEGTIHSLEKGGLITLNGGVPHDLKAVKDSIIRLTLSLSDNAHRVKAVAKD